MEEIPRFNSRWCLLRYTSINPTAWYLNEKFDEVRWNGKNLYLLNGRKFYPPKYFLKQFPKSLSLIVSYGLPGMTFKIVWMRKINGNCYIYGFHSPSMKKNTLNDRLAKHQDIICIPKVNAWLLYHKLCK